MALQIRRGTNKQRLGVTLVEGEVAFVTDFELVSIEVTSIDVTTNILTTALVHGLTVGDQVKFTSSTANGLTQNTVYFVKTTPDNNNFTLSTTLSGATLDITGVTGTVSLEFAVGPTNGSGQPLGYSVSPLWVGDGITAGGVASGATILDELKDVTIGVDGAVGLAIAANQHLQFDATTNQWRNVTDVVVPGTLYAQGNVTVNNGTILTNATTATVMNTTATTVNAFGAATALNLGATSGTTTVRNSAVVTGDLAVNGGDITTTSGSGNLFNNAGVNVVNIGNGADTEVNIGSPTGGSKVQIKPQTLVGISTTQNVFNTVATTVNAFGAATALNLGATSGTTTINNNAVITGNLTVNGTQTIVNSTTMTVDDPNIVLNSVGTPTDSSANNGGITVKGDSDKVLYWNNSDKRWYFNNGTGATSPADGSHKMVVELTDLDGVETGLYHKGHMFYYDGTYWVNGSNIKFDDVAYRPWISTQVNNNSNTVDSSLVLMKDYDTNSYGTGAGSGLVFGIDSNGQGAIGLARISSTYDADGVHNVNIGTNITSSTYNNLIDTSVERTSINDGVLYVDAVSNFVGINTDSPSVALEVTGAVAATGNIHTDSDLTVQGDLLLSDTMILNNGVSTGANAYIKVDRGSTGTDASITWDETNDRWITSNNLTSSGSISATGSIYAEGEGNVYISGLDIVLNNGFTGAPSSDAGLTVVRGDQSNATFKWTESQDWWGTDQSIWAGNSLIAGTVLATNGNNIIFNNDDTTPNITDHANLTVKRGSGADVTLRWNESDDRWQTTVDGSTFVNMPVQSLDTTSSPVFAGTTSGNIRVGVTGDNEIDTTTGNLTINSAGGTTTIDDDLTVSGNIRVNGNRIKDSAGRTALQFGNDGTNYWTLFGSGYDGANCGYVFIDQRALINTGALTTTTTTANQVLDSFVAASYRSCKYYVQISSGSEYQAFEGIVVHNGTSAFLTAFNDVRTNGNLATIAVDISAGSVRLLVTPVNAATTFKITKTLITV